MSNEDIKLYRPYTKDDIPFIHSSWGESYYDGIQAHKQLLPHEFHAYHRPLRERTLNNPNAAAIICSSKESPELILGWILVEKPHAPYIKLHYIYVKQDFQHRGIAKELVQRALPIRPVLFTHQTFKAKRIMRDNWRNDREDFDRFILTPHLI